MRGYLKCLDCVTLYFAVKSLFLICSRFNAYQVEFHTNHEEFARMILCLSVVVTRSLPYRFTLSENCFHFMRLQFDDLASLSVPLLPAGRKFQQVPLRFKYTVPLPWKDLWQGWPVLH